MRTFALIDTTVQNDIEIRTAYEVVTIVLEALVENEEELAHLVTKSRVAAVVKADVYSLGVAYVAPVLYNTVCHNLFVVYCI